MAGLGRRTYREACNAIYARGLIAFEHRLSCAFKLLQARGPLLMGAEQPFEDALREVPETSSIIGCFWDWRLACRRIAGTLGGDCG
eukprot:7419268-Pyramimonas_sp.AAC.1